MNLKRVLVTGAAGFIGSHTVDCLLQRGVEVVAVDSFRTGCATNIRQCAKHSGFVFEFADISQDSVLESLCLRYRPDAIIHLAGLVSVVQAQENPDLNYLLNIHTTHLVAEAARASGTRRVVFASSAAVYGDSEELPVSEAVETRPISLYGMAKRVSEQILEGHAKTFGLEVASLRFFNVFGPRQDPQSPYSGVMSIFAKRFAEGKPVKVFGDGSQTRDFISVFDVAEALSQAAAVPAIESEICNVCTGAPVSLLDIISEFQSLYPEAPEPLFLEAREGEILHSAGDPVHAASILDFHAGVPLHEGMKALVEVNQPEGLKRSALVPQLA
ncbi:MAG: NAD-dependent epimerase/dehydratase family protein [Verrucomicrobiales bacterium]|nr:NAD-dependent epimerase/dehydratase family protein [Verrucomicrobiales bacterium]